MMEQLDWAEQADLYPHEFSGTETAVWHARALSINPSILWLMSRSVPWTFHPGSDSEFDADIQQKFNLSYIFIAHGLIGD